VWFELLSTAHELPNLLHLCLTIKRITRREPPFDPLSWTPLPLLRSLSINLDGGCRYLQFGPYITDILRGAPRLVALQIEEDDALEAIDFIRIHGEEMLESGVKRAPLRILILTTDSQGARRWGDLPDVTPILCTWDANSQAEWHSQPCTVPIKIGHVEVSRRCFHGELSPPLSVRADEITD